MIKNKSTLGLSSFIKEFYNDLKNGHAKGWWNERYSRKGESLSVTVNDSFLKSTYEVVEYIKNNFQDITEEQIKEIQNHVQNVYMVLNYKRVYLWEVDVKDDSKESVQVKQEVNDELQQQEEEQEQRIEEEKVEEPAKPSPDFNYAKSLADDKQALKEYAAEFGFELDSRKAFKNMLKVFQGKYHSTKARK